MALTIEYLNKSDLKPFAKNAKLHPAEQIEQIKKSITDFGFNDPIGIYGDNEVVEGHGRLLAVMEMDDVKEVPVIRLDHMSSEERRAYALVHNQLTMNSGFDFDLLQEELDSLSIDMGDFGFTNIEVDSFFDDERVNAHENQKKQGFSIICTCEDEVSRDELIEYLDSHGIEYKI